MSAQLPERIGRYRTGRVLGKGGFGVVVRAEDHDLGVSVAVKILSADWASDSGVRNRFIEEARLLRSVRSEYLVSVHDIGELDDGRPFFVMDLADRGTLADRITSLRGVDTISLRSLVGALMGALSTLHAEGYVHRDVTPGNLFIQRKGFSRANENMQAATAARAGLIAGDEQIILGDLGFVKDLAGEAAEMTLLGGTPLYRAPEQAEPGAPITPAADVYGATAVLWAVLAGEAPPDPHHLKTSLNKIGDAWRSFMQRGLMLRPEERFASMLEWQMAAEKALGQSSSVVQINTAHRYHSELNPYLGLAAFQPDDADRFFGRDKLVNDLVVRVRSQRVLVVGGASGSGKSSLIRAGFIPAIKSGVLADSERWPVVLFTPGANPLQELEYQLRKVLEDLQTPVSFVGERLEETRWRRLTERITDVTGGVLICIDQFEELFTFDHDESVIEATLAAFASITDPASSRAHLVIVIRADFYGASSKYPWLANTITENQVLVGPMTRTELREAITEPASQANLHLDDALVDAVLDETGSTSGSLPLISHALAETWKRREGSRLTLKAYRETGGVAGAIGQSAEALYEKRFNAQEQETVRRLLMRLISPGDGVPDTRRPLPLAELQPKLQANATSLVDARLLTIDRETIQLAHEAIIQSWPRLRMWIDESRDDLREQQRIERSTSEWFEADRDPDLLYRGARLATVSQWAKTHGDDLNELQTEYLSSAIEAEQAASEKEQEAERRVRRNRRLAFASLAGLTIAAVVMSVVAFNALRKAQQNEIAANERLAQSLASQAAELVDEDPRLALALASEVIARTDTPPVEARMTLVKATSQMQIVPYSPAATPLAVGDALTVTIHPRKDLIVTGNRDGRINFWNSAGDLLFENANSHRAAIEEMVFAQNGQHLVTSDVSGILVIWDVSKQSAPVPTQLASLGKTMWTVSVSHAADRVVAGTHDGEIWIFEPATNDKKLFVNTNEVIYTVKLSPDGKTVFAGTGHGQVLSWRTETGEVVLPPLNAHQSDLWEIEFLPEINAFATVAGDGRVRIWDSKTYEEKPEPFANMDMNVRGVQLDANGVLIAGDHNGSLLFWDTSHSKFIAKSKAQHDAKILDAAVQVDGNMAVSLGLDQILRIWQRNDEQGFRSVLKLDGSAFGLALSSDTKRLAIGDSEGNVRILATDSGRVIAGPWRLSDAAIWAVAFDNKTERFAAGDQNGAVAIWELSSGRLIAEKFDAQNGAISTIVFQQDGESLFSAGADGMVNQLSTATLDRVSSGFSGHSGGATRISLSPDGKALATVDRVGQLRIWDTQTHSLINEWAADDNTIWSVTWSPDGTEIATAHADEQITVWDARLGEKLKDMTPHPGGATDLAFLSDGLTLASTSRDGTVRLWDRNLGVSLGAVLGGNAAPWRLVASTKNNWFATTNTDGDVDIWDVLQPEAVCNRASWDVAAQRRYLGVDSSPVACQQASSQ